MVEVHNKCDTMGCHYLEDDWTIKVIAPSYEESIELIIPKYVNSSICPDDIQVLDVEYVTYKGKQHVLDIRNILKKGFNTVLTDIKEHPLFERLSKERYEKMEVKKIKELKKKEKQNEEAERALLEKLSIKYNT